MRKRGGKDEVLKRKREHETPNETLLDSFKNFNACGLKSLRKLEPDVMRIF